MLGIVILVALVQLLGRTRNIWLCAGIYTGVGFLFDLLAERPIAELAITAIVDLGGSYLLFYLLLRFEDSRALWWTILIGFIALPFFLVLAGA